MKIRDRREPEKKQVDSMKDSRERVISCAYCDEVFKHLPDPKGEQVMFTCKLGRGRFWIDFEPNEDEKAAQFKKAVEED